VAKATYSKQLTALVVVDPYNDFISEGGKIWDRIRGVAEANDCVPHMLQILNAARNAKLPVFYAMHHRYRPGDYETWKYIAPIQRAAWRSKCFEYGKWGGEFRAEFERTEGFASPGGAIRDKSRMYELPARLRRNDWALSGDWTIKRDAVELNQPNGRIAYRFHARDLHLVMGPAAPGTSVKFRVLIDGQPPGVARGIDVDEQGGGTVTEQRLHQLIRQTGPIADHQFEIEFLDPGVEAFCFTFG
jgi:thioredoxin family protein/isochorismatase family protein